ncbi:hypothetical protein K440DRAFT_571251, partial [Wilcoxina mikolae CBS 423.85]
TSMLRMGDKLVPLTLMSGRAHLLNSAGDKKECPVYITISDLSSKIPKTPSIHRVVMVTLLPIHIKNCNNHQKQLDELRQTNQEVLHEVLLWVLHPLTFKHNPSAEREYLECSFCISQLQALHTIFS